MLKNSKKSQLRMERCQEHEERQDEAVTYGKWRIPISNSDQIKCYDLREMVCNSSKRLLVIADRPDQTYYYKSRRNTSIIVGGLISVHRKHILD